MDVEQNFAFMNSPLGAHLTTARHDFIIQRSCMSYGPITPNWGSCSATPWIDTMCHSRQINCQQTLQYLYTTAVKLIIDFKGLSKETCTSMFFRNRTISQPKRCCGIAFPLFLFPRFKTKRQATTSLWLCIRPPKWPYFGLPRNATVLQWISPGLQLPRWRARAQFTTTAKASMQPAFFMPSLGHQV